MGKVCTVHGCIFGNARGNINTIETLPADDDWPRLTRNMFSITSTDYDRPGFYKIQMIHFGASIKYLDEDWHEWLEKFESLLERLSWSEVFMLLTMDWPSDGFKEKRYEYKWEHKWENSGSSKIRNWNFDGGPRIFIKHNA